MTEPPSAPPPPEEPPASHPGSAPTPPMDAASPPSDQPPGSHPGSAPPPPMDATAAPPPGYAPTKTNGLAITSMVLGILGILLFWFFGLGVLLGILAVIFGFIARGQIAREGQGGRGMALAGIITGFVAVGLLVLLVLIGFGLGLSGEFD